MLICFRFSDTKSYTQTGLCDCYIICVDGTILHINKISENGVFDDIDFFGFVGYWVLKLRGIDKFVQFDGGCGECASVYYDNRIDNVVFPAFSSYEYN
jgi:hypothetical protein